MKITKEQLKQIIKEELGKNYHLGEYGNPTILYINFRNLKDVGENMPGGVDPEEIEGIMRGAVGDVYSGPQDEWARYAVHKIKVDDKSGGGYRDPSKSKYQVLLDFENEEDWEDFGGRLNLIMQRVNDKVEKYAMKLRQYSLRDVTTGSLFENKKNITKQQLKRIIKEELSNVLKEEDYDYARDKHLERGGRYRPAPARGPFPGTDGRGDAILGIPNRGQELYGDDEHSLWAYNNAYESGAEWAKGNPYIERHVEKILAKRAGDPRLEYKE